MQAGGKGNLPWLLKNADGIDAVVVDPRVTDHSKIIRSAQYLANNPEVAHIRRLPGLQHQALAVLIALDVPNSETDTPCCNGSQSPVLEGRHAADGGGPTKNRHGHQQVTIVDRTEPDGSDQVDGARLAINKQCGDSTDATLCDGKLRAPFRVARHLRCHLDAQMLAALGTATARCSVPGQLKRSPLGLPEEAAPKWEAFWVEVVSSPRPSTCQEVLEVGLV